MSDLVTVELESPAGIGDEAGREERDPFFESCQPACKDPARVWCCERSAYSRNPEEYKLRVERAYLFVTPWELA